MKTFKFKQFEIVQDNVSMRVTTDAVVFGAWIEANEPQNILDIGTGTGILALMMAQKFTNSKITAIDIDETAYKEAFINFKNSKWFDRLEVKHIDFVVFAQNCTEKYDLIVCNPPFFDNHLLSKNYKDQLAKHNISLTYETLLKNAVNLLSTKGILSIIVPFDVGGKIIRLANKQLLFCDKRCDIIPKPDKKPNRTMFQFSFNIQKTENETVVVRNDDNSYNKKFLCMTSEFYIFA